MSVGRGHGRVLVLYWALDDQLRNAIAHHLHALDYGGPASVVYYNARRGAPAWLDRLGFDAIVLHTTFLCMRWSYLFYPWKLSLEWIARSKARKIALPQDEYDHSEVLDEWLYELGVDTIFTNFGEDVRAQLYPLMHSRATYVRAFTGYVDDTTTERLAAETLPTDCRSIDIVYRATHLPYWFGSHGQLKHAVGDVVRGRALELGMRVDISTRAEHTITGDDWPRFLASGRTVIGVESGSSVLDRRGEIRARIQALLRDDPEMSFAEVDRKMPPGWDGHRFFALSPRHFEAIASHTCQVLVEGSYDGVLVPDRHYIPLQRDFGNLDDVLDKVRDTELVSRIADQAYSDIVGSGKHNYRALALKLEDAMGPPRLQRRYPRIADAAADVALKLDEVAAARFTAYEIIRAAPPSAVTRGLVAMALAMRYRSLRRLSRQVRHRRKAISVTRAMADLLRLGLLLHGVRGRLGGTPPFAVRASLEPAQTLVLQSVPRAFSLEGGLDEAAVRRLITSGRVTTIVWDHSAVGDRFELDPRYGGTLNVGEHGEHRFDWISLLMSDRAVVVAEAVADVVRRSS